MPNATLTVETTNANATEATVDVNAFTFGVEFEVTVPRGVVNVGGYRSGNQIPGLPAGWKAQYDSSIRAGSGHEGAEIVSPILRGADGLLQVKTVCDWLTVVGAKVNKSTGFHVHVGFTGTQEQLERLTQYVANFEKAFFAASGTRTREEGSYCRPIRDSGEYVARFVDGTRDTLPANRYHMLNLTNLRPGGRGTVEFRVFAGTTNVVKAVGYIRMCLAIMEKALKAKRGPKWINTPASINSPIRRKGGDGQTELTRFFYGCGWIHGREAHTFGNVVADGVPTVADCKPELMRLAKKYDDRVEEETTVATPAGVSWTNWTPSMFTQWESMLRAGSRVRACLNGSECDARVVRRFARSIRVTLMNGQERNVPRVGAESHSDTFRLVPAQ